MKISRLHIDNFAIEESPTITEEYVEGKDLLLYGGNRSGKSLSFNAILYALFGRRGTNDISPGRSSEVKLHFDNADAVIRQRTHEYQHGDGTLDANEGVSAHIGEEGTIGLQFIPSNPSNQPLDEISGERLLDRIREVVSTTQQEAIEYHRRAAEEIGHIIETIERGESEPGIDELKDDIQEFPIGRTENRVQDIEEFLSLIDSGEIGRINTRLQNRDEITERLDELYDRKRNINQTLRETRRELGDAKRYTEEVNDLIIDAIKEFTCPVCGRLVEERTARHRLKNGNCPQCGRGRNLNELKQKLEERVSVADDKIKNLRNRIEELEEELEQVNSEIEDLQQAESELSQLTGFIRTALQQADYEVEKAKKRAEEEVDEKTAALEEMKKEKEQLERQLKRKEHRISELAQDKEIAIRRSEELEEEVYEEIRTQFAEKWSQVYQDIAPNLGTEIRVTPEGELELPGAGSEGLRPYERLSSGERRLLNVSFSITVAKVARENPEAHNWEVLVLDEPLTNLESDLQHSTARYLRESDTQCIMTTPLERIQSHFQDADAQIIPLDRISTQSTQLNDFL